MANDSLAGATAAAFVPARREYKYLLPRRLMPSLRAALRGRCTADRYGGPDGTYRIRSLYFDDDGLGLYQATERDAPSRYNARVRQYPDAAQAPIMAEIKARNGDTIQKSRGLLAPDRWAAVVGGGPVDATPPLENFLSRVQGRDLRPRVLIQYRREAWASDLDGYARVSVDTEIVGQRWERLSFDIDERDFRPLDTPMVSWTRESICVLELKFADRAPRWMVDLVQSMELLRHSFSKFKYGMRAVASAHHAGLRDPASPLWVAS